MHAGLGLGFGRTVAEGRVSRPDGQVENQVGNLRDLLFLPNPRVQSLIELNAWLADQCIAYAKRTRHPKFKERTIWEVFEEERASLMALRGPFDGFVEKTVRASTNCLIMADHNRYSVDARAAGVRRRQDDHRHARPADPSLRHHRDRKHQLALQEPQLITTTARSHRAQCRG